MEPSYISLEAGASWGILLGPDIIVSSHAASVERKQVRFPRSKKKRIRKKWERDPKNWKTRHKPGIYRMGNTFIMDPASYKELQERVHPVELPAATPTTFSDSLTAISNLRAVLSPTFSIFPSKLVELSAPTLDYFRF